jgi:hypothetical protein
MRGKLLECNGRLKKNIITYNEHSTGNGIITDADGGVRGEGPVIGLAWWHGRGLSIDERAGVRRVVKRKGDGEQTVFGGWVAFRLGGMVDGCREKSGQ